MTHPVTEPMQAQRNECCSCSAAKYRILEREMRNMCAKHVRVEHVLRISREKLFSYS